MSEKYTPTPEELARSQDAFQEELLLNGARLVQDPGADKPRVELTDSTNAPKDKDGYRMGGQLEDAQVVDDMITSNKERAGQETASDFIDWIQAHPYQSLSFIMEQFGSLEEFKRQAEASGQARFKDLAEDSEKPQDAKAA